MLSELGQDTILKIGHIRTSVSTVTMIARLEKMSFVIGSPFAVVVPEAPYCSSCREPTLSPTRGACNIVKGSVNTTKLQNVRADVANALVGAIYDGLRYIGIGDIFFTFKLTGPTERVSALRGYTKRNSTCPTSATCGVAQSLNCVFAVPNQPLEALPFWDAAACTGRSMATTWRMTSDARHLPSVTGDERFPPKSHSWLLHSNN